MKKKQKLILSWGMTVFAAACGVAAFFTVFADAITYSYNILGNLSYTGLQVALGYSLKSGALELAVFNASAGIILAYLLPMIGACGLIIGKDKKIVMVLSSALMVAGGVLCFLLVQFLSGPNVGTPLLAAGPIAAGVLAAFGGVCGCASAFLKN